MEIYRPNEFEKSWREKWEKQQLYNVDNKLHINKPKYYCLEPTSPGGAGDGGQVRYNKHL